MSTQERHRGLWLERIIVLTVLSCGLFLPLPAIAALSGEVPASLPIWFEQNAGQAAEDALFVVRGPEHTLCLTKSAARLSLTGGASLTMTLAESSEDSVPRSLQASEGKANYLRGSDASAWLTNIPMFDRVQRTDAYPGIDLIFHGSQRELEYDFVVRPGADPASIHMRFQGMDGLELAENGDLLLRVGTECIRHRAPVAYIRTGNTPHPVSCRYIVRDGKTVDFAVAPYDRSQTLVIDPVVVFSTCLGDIGSGRGVGTDAQGNVYVGGFTHSIGIPVANAYQKDNKGGIDIFVIKLTPAADKVLYATYLGGELDDDIKAMTVDAEGNAYLGGRTKSKDFPTTEGTISRTHAATFDNIVAKLAPTGDKLIYATYLGGESMEEIRGIAIDPQGNCAVAGGTHSTDFPTTSKAFKPQYTDTREPDPEKKTGKPFTAEDAFVAKLNPTGTALVFCSFLGGHGYDKAWGCAMDSAGAVYVTGYSSSKDFPVTSGVVQPKHAGGDPKGNFGELDVFVTKFSPDGSHLVFSTLLGGSGSDKGEGIGVDAKGNVYIAGDTESTEFPVNNAQQSKHAAGKSDAFVTKLSPNADKILWSTYLGGSGDDVIGSDALAVDGKGDVYVVGSTKSADFPVSNAMQSKPGGEEDGFVCMLKSSGEMGYSSFMGGESDDACAAIAVDEKGAAYVVGSTGSGLFPPMKPFHDQQTGKRGVFVLKMAPQK